MMADMLSITPLVPSVSNHEGLHLLPTIQDDISREVNDLRQAELILICPLWKKRVFFRAALLHITIILHLCRPVSMLTAFQTYSNGQRPDTPFNVIVQKWITEMLQISF